jgi:hypothetical protein
MIASRRIRPHCPLTLEPSIRQLRGDPAVCTSAFSDWSVPYFHLKNNPPCQHNISIPLFRRISRNWWINWEISTQIRSTFRPSTIPCVTHIWGWKSILRFNKRNLLRLKDFRPEDTSRSEILARDISHICTSIEDLSGRCQPSLKKIYLMELIVVDWILLWTYLVVQSNFPLRSEKANWDGFA